MEKMIKLLVEEYYNVPYGVRMDNLMHKASILLKRDGTEASVIRELLNGNK